MMWNKLKDFFLKRGKPAPSEWPANAESYKVQDYLGQGGYAKIFSGTCTENGKQVAIKMIKDVMEEDIKDYIECSYSNIFHHDNVMCIYTHFLNDTKLWLVMEICDVGALNDIFPAYYSNTYNNVNLMSESIIACIVKQLLDGLSYLHSQGLVHRDVKLANILITSSGVVKICDFGLCTKINAVDEKRLQGSKPYMAPELLSNLQYSFKGDVWAVGLVTLELATGHMTFAESDVAKLIKMQQAYRKCGISLKNLKKEYHNKFTQDYHIFLSNSLEFNPSERANVEYLLEMPLIKKAHAPGYLIEKLQLKLRGQGKGVKQQHYGS